MSSRAQPRAVANGAKRSSPSRGDNPWSAGATWACCAAVLAGGLTPCAVYAAATHRYGWAAAFALTLAVVAAVPLCLTVFAGRRSLRLFSGSLYLLSGLWILLWSASPDVEGYVLEGLLGTGGFLFLLGLLLTVIYLTEGAPAKGGPAARRGREKAEDGDGG